MKKYIISLFIMINLTFSSAIFAAGFKIAVVNMQKILQSSQQVQEANAKFKKEFAPRDANIKAQQQTLQKAVQKFKRNISVMNDKQKAAAEKNIQKLSKKLQQTQIQFEQDLQTAQAKTMKKILQKIKTAANKIAKKNNYDMVLQNSATVFYKNQYDITNQVIKALN